MYSSILALTRWLDSASASVLYGRYLLEEAREVLAHACEGLGTCKRLVRTLRNVGGGEDLCERGDGLSAELQQEFRNVVDGGKQPVVELLELGMCLEEVTSGYVPVLVLELVVLDGEVGEKGVELGLHGWILSVVSRLVEPLLGQFLVSGTIPDWSLIVNRNLS
jgi:hypothetical protein